ncbi:hypothetical protein VTL71DRAFT_8600 [Oculimacula yallundae]|uniref:Uncharacterized protein n=1 Tax=Oculimacula yallundae TaxID=86028 RepID=A0ABR4D0A7_9HELO
MSSKESSEGLATSDIIGIAVGVPSGLLALAAVIVSFCAWQFPESRIGRAGVTIGSRFSILGGHAQGGEARGDGARGGDAEAGSASGGGARERDALRETSSAGAGAQFDDVNDSVRNVDMKVQGGNARGGNAYGSTARGGNAKGGAARRS